ncbi:MAG: biopolymer transporter ExbD [Chitinivibrionales bacterium]|nr:biopolymer transporter ExbD [Chitinivibrionales bacterium]
MINLHNPFMETQNFFPELTSLIDVMFLLLIFFMLTTTFENSKGIESILMELPYSQKSIPVEKEETVGVSVDENGSFFVNKQTCSPEALPAMIGQALQNKRDTTIVISGHKNAPYQSIIFIYDIIQSLGIRNIAHEVQ